MRRLPVALAAAAMILGVLPRPAAQQVRDRPQPAAAAERASVAGRVEVEVDGHRLPVRRARVTLTAEGDGKPRTITTDADGRFRLDHLAAGSYRLRADKPGFVPVSQSALSSSVQLKDDALAVNVLMQRGAALGGRFLDDRGTPIKRLEVYADRLDDSATRRADSRSALTDDLGRFRVHTLPPGRYVVHARPMPPASGEDLYYPGTPNSQQASVIALTAGQTLEHLDFTVPTAPLSPWAASAISSTASKEIIPLIPTGGLSASTTETPEAGGTVSGRLTRSDTGQPIANAMVTLQSTDIEPPRRPRTIRSDANGQFEFTSVVLGSYAVAATAEGFVGLGGAYGRVDVTDRARIEIADLALDLPGAIEGRVLDEFGDPAPGISLQIARAVNAAGRAVLFPAFTDSSTGPTDDRGWFRVYGLTPGDYYVFAIPSAVRGLTTRNEPPGTDVADDPGAGFATTFFPGTESLDAASPVQVVVNDTRDVTFRLLATRMIAISGGAADLAGRPVPNARLMLIQTYGGEVRTLIGATVATGVDGSFRFRGVPEGSYVLQGFADRLFGSLPIEATGSPPAVILTLRPLATARGHVSFEGPSTPPVDPASVRINFQPTDFASGPIGSNAIISKIDPSWNFEIPNLAWMGLIRATGPSGWALKSVTLNGRDFTDTPASFQSGDVNGIDIVMTSRVGSVTGTVQDNGKAVANASVIVFGSDESTWSLSSRFIKGARSNAQGTFTVPGLLPGKYVAVAIAPTALPPIDPTALGSLRPLGTPIDVTDVAGPPVILTVIKR